MGIIDGLKKINSWFDKTVAEEVEEVEQAWDVLTGKPKETEDTPWTRTDHKVRERLVKLASRYKRDTGAEKDSAKNMLDSMLAKHGLTYGDIPEDLIT